MQAINLTVRQMMTPLPVPCATTQSALRDPYLHGECISSHRRRSRCATRPASTLIYEPPHIRRPAYSTNRRFGASDTYVRALKTLVPRPLSHAALAKAGKGEMPPSSHQKAAPASQSHRARVSRAQRVPPAPTRPPFPRLPAITQGPHPQRESK